MEEKKLRQYDFITSIFLLCFGVWELAQAFKMPMKDSYGGVQSVWYVSPALLPLFVGGGILLLGTILLINSIKTGGAADLINALKKGWNFKVSTPVSRILTVVLGLFTLIYLFIPRIDFYLSLALFLFYVCAAFYPDNENFRVKITIRYLAGSLVFLLLFISGLGRVLQDLLKYNLDILTLAFIIYLNVSARHVGRMMAIDHRKFRTVTIISLVVPLILCPLFRYFLLVPLPYEGGIIKLMNLAYYALR